MVASSNSPRIVNCKLFPPRRKRSVSAFFKMVFAGFRLARLLNDTLRRMTPADFKQLCV
jgi:hypothetical protein